jgi:hypothetical protein
LIERGLEVVGELNEPDNVNILTFDEADHVEQQQVSSSSNDLLWRPGMSNRLPRLVVVMNETFD